MYKTDFPLGPKRLTLNRGTDVAQSGLLIGFLSGDDDGFDSGPTTPSIHLQLRRVVPYREAIIAYICMAACVLAGVLWTQKQLDHARPVYTRMVIASCAADGCRRH